MKALAFLILTAAPTFAQDGFSFGSENGPFRLNLRPSVEAVVWSGDTPAPALIDSTGHTFFAPRFSMATDATAGEHLFLHTTTRWDNGFDPVSDGQGEVRLDEAFLRWSVYDDQRLNFQIGKFPSVFGAWSGQHDFFDDPFLLAPLQYSQIIGVNTRSPDANTPESIRARADGSAAAVSTLAKENWASILWGPGYASGANVFGSTEHLDYALEIKNTALSSHPDSWTDLDFSSPTVTGRLGYRPDAAWAIGLSASRGPWMEDEASGLLPPGADREDFTQNTLGLDVRWAHHNVIVSGEVVISEFETPTAGDLRTASWFLQTRWKVSPGVWLAARFGWISANDATDPAGNDVSWQPDVWRAEIGGGWRVSPNILFKAGYSFTHSAGDTAAGEQLLGTGIGLRF